MSTEGKYVQLDLFAQQKELQNKIADDEFKKNVTKSVRGLFARYNDLEMAFLDMHKQIDRLNEATFRHG